ncbi:MULTISPECIES: ABC transporter ATP-binding protein [Bacillaceae]|uniref:ABC transporter ATP-binding protein n=1 Tax=Metabacillus sediminis TaxID=3117746 RepID=A0ABZ2NGB6_9BACI|nr:ABC transporter ATP-binding protein [Bacillus sp. SJS]KZZ83869.1 ABC transporter [Bacillus sp. SJS]
MFVQIQNLHFQYRNSNEQTIQDFVLSIEEGEIVSILGNSGSGKSTILRLIAGLEVPSSGSIEINNKIVSNPFHFIQPEKRGVGLVFQDYALFPHLSVADNIKFGLKKRSKKEKNERVKELLHLVGLHDFANRYPYELSGGQQQRVALARALAPNPSLLMLDEPFSNLDSELQQKIRDELRSILKQTGITSIFVTHDREDARSLADRIVIMKDGKITQIGKPCDLLAEDMETIHQKEYIK